MPTAKDDVDVKAQALALMATGVAVTEVSRRLRIGYKTLMRWKEEEAYSVTISEQAVIGELIIKYIRTSFETLTKQAELFGDKAWLAKQRASDVAILHGVVADKMHRLLEAMSQPTDPTVPPSLEGHIAEGEEIIVEPAEEEKPA